MVSSKSFSSDCPTSSGTITAGNATSCDVTDAGTSTVITLNFNTGFDSAILIESDTAGPNATDTYLSTASGKTVSSATSMAASTAAASIASGNNGTTVGAQRKLAFIKAAEIIASQINTTEPIVIDAEFSALGCSSGSATLGSAGASGNLAYGDSAAAGYLPNTLYPIGLFNSIAGSDADAGLSDVSANFNTNTGSTNCLESSNGWYYGFDTPPSVVYTDENGDSLNLVDGNGDPLAISYIGFTTVLLHEITHGLGFASTFTASTGAKGGVNADKDDIFSNNLYDNANSRNWNDASETDGQRAASAISDTGLLWTGVNVNTQAIGLLTAGFQDNDGDPAFTSGDKVQMYAPNPIEGDSSISHFNTAASPNELMEPQYTEGSLSLGLALYLLQDIGWSITAPSANNAPTITITGTPYSTNEDTPKVIDASGWDADADGDTVTFSVSSCPANITCAIDNDGQNLTLTPDSNYNGATNSVEITVTDDGVGSLSASASFNLDVIAQNDAPAINGIPDIGSLNQGSTSSPIDLDTYTSDIDGDTAFTYTASACGANLTCNITGSSLTITAGMSFSGHEDVTIQAKDAGLLTNSDTFTVYATPTIEFNNVTLQPNDTPNAASNDALTLDITNVAGIFDFDLDFDGSDVSNSLMVINGTSLSIAMPTSGQFAGTYTLTATDSISGNEYEYTFVRSPRLSLSATKILSNTSIQTLTIEGGAASTVYTLTSSESALSFSINNAEVTTASASDDGANFNPATLTLTAGTVLSSTSTELSVASIYETVSTSGLTIEPARIHTITIEDNDGVAINQAQLSLDVSNLLAFNLVEDYSSNSAGELTITLPDDGNYYDVVASYTGLVSVSTTLVSSVLEQTITLSPPINHLDLTGIIKASSSVSFSSELPVVTLSLIDSSTVNIPVTATSDSQVEFDYTHDLNNGDVSSITFSHSGAVDVTINLLTSSSFDFDVTMDARSATIVIVASSSGGGLVYWLLLLLLMATRVNRKPIKSL